METETNIPEDASAMAFHLHEATGNTCMENEKKAEPQSQAQSLEAVATKHPNLEGQETKELSPSNDSAELEKFPVSHTREKLEIKEGGKIIQEEAKDMQEATDMWLLKTATESVTDVKAPSTLPTLAIVKHETDEKRYQEQTDKQVESTVIDNDISRTRENELEQTTKVHEAIDITKTMGKVCAENEEHAHHLSEAQSIENLNIKHTNSEGMVTTESSTKLSNDKEELENIPQLEELEEATDMQLPETATESVHEHEAPSTLPTSTNVQGETTEKSIQEHTHKEVESRAIDNEKSCRPENELEQVTKVLEAIYLHKTMAKVRAENEEHAYHQSEAPSLENDITNHTKDVKELEKIPESRSVENREIKDGGKMTPKEAIGVTEDETWSTLLTIASVEVETVEKSIEEEKHKEAESAVTNTEEGQTHENDIEETKKVPEAFDLRESITGTNLKNEKKAKPQSEAQSLKTMAIKHPNLERQETTEINLSNEAEELEKEPVPYTREKLVIKGGGKIIQEEAKEMEQAAEKQLPKTVSESVPEHEAPSTLSMAPIVHGETIQKSNQEQTHKEEESTAKDNDRSCTPENELEQLTEVLEAIDVPETKGKVGAENEELADRQSEAPRMENETSKNTDSEEMVTMESSTKSSYDVKELEKIPQPPCVEKREIKADGKTRSEEAIGAPEDETVSILPTIASVEVETAEKSNQEEIHKEVESAVTDTEEEQRPENDFEETKKVPEAFNLHEAIASTSKDNGKKYEPQSDVEGLKTMIIKHLNLEGLEITEIYASNDTEELENVPESHTEENLEIKDGGNIIQEEAKEIEQATEMQLPKTATESVPEHESPSTLSIAPIVQGDKIQKCIPEQTHNQEKSTVIDNDRSCTPENELEQVTEVLEAIDLPKTKGKVGAENEEQADHQSEAPSMEKMTTKNTDSEEKVTTESSTKLSYDVKELQKIPKSPSVKNREIKDDGKTSEEAIGVPEDETLSTSPTIASVVVETVDKSIQEEIHMDVNSAVTYTEEGQTPENEFEESKKVFKAFDLLEAIDSTSEDKEKKAEPQSDAQSLETMVIKHPNLEALETTETNPSNDTEELEKVPAENLEMKDGRIIIQEEAKEMTQATEMQSPKIVKERVPEQEATSTLSIAPIVQGETIQKSIQKQTHKEEESTTIDNDRSCTPENELEQMTEVLEAIDLTETKGKVGAENEEYADHQSEALRKENVTTKKTNSEEMVTTESSTKSSYDVKELEKIPESPSVENREIKVDGKTTSEEAIGVPEDETLSTSPTIALVDIETVDKSIPEEIHKLVKSAVTYTKEGQRPENDFEETKKAPEAFDLLEAIANTSEDKEKQAESQSDAQSLKTMVIKQPNFEALETTETNLSNDTEELENVPASHTKENLEMKDGRVIIQEEAKEMEQATEMQSPKTVEESVPEHEAPSTLSIAPIVQGETIQKSIQEQTHKEEESTTIDNDRSCTPKNELEQMTEVLEAIDLTETKGKVSAENEEHADHQSEAPRMGNVTTKNTDSEEMVTTESSTKSSYDVKELQKIPESPSVKNQVIKDDGKTTSEEAIGVPEHEAPSTLSIAPIVQGETIQKSIQEQTHKEEESTAIDNDRSCTPQNELEQTTEVLEAIDLTDTKGKVSAENEEHADHQSEAPRMENVTTNNTYSEEMVTTESSTKSSYDVKELQNIPESPSIKNREIMDDGKASEEAIGAPEDETLSTLPTIASIEVETVEKSIQQEIHKEVESAVTDTKEGQRQENDLEETKKVSEAFDLHEATASTSEENEQKAEPQSDAQDLETMVIKHPTLEGLETTEINGSNDTEELENVPPSHTEENLEIKDGGKIIQEEAKEMEQATEMQLPKTVTESVPEHEAPSTLSMAPIVQGETIQKSNQEQTHKEEESTAIDKDRSCTPENELEQTTEVLEAIDLPETKGKVGAENEEHADHLSEAPSMENVTTKNIDSEEMVTMECSTKSSYDVKELEKIPESPSVENREMKDDGKTTSEEAIGLPEYETLSTLPTIASVEVATVEKGSQEEIHKEAKSAVIETEEGQRQENDFEETKKVPEAFDFHEAKASTSTENEKKAEPQSEAQSLENMVIKHPNFERLGTTEINTSNDTEELENIPVCHTGEKLENKDGGKIIQEEAKEMEQATYMQLPKTVTESVPEHEAPSTLPTSEIVQDETIEKMIQEKTHKEEESTAIDNEQNSSSKNELKQTTKVLEHMLKQAIDLPKTMGKVGAENEEHAEHQILTMESRTKSSCDVEKLENILDSQSVENSEIKNGGKFTPEEAIDIKEGTDVELQKSETESVLEDKAISTLPTIASVRVDTVEKIIQEDLQKEAESAVTDTNNKQRPENDFEEKKKVPEAFDLHDATGNTSAENEKKVELQSEVQSLETMDIKHPNLEGLETTEINPCKDTEELEKFPASHTEEKLEIKDGRNIIQEEAKETEQAADMQLPKTATESLPEDKARSTLPTSAIVKGRTVEKSFQEQTLKEEESTAIDNDKSSRPQNEFEQTTEVLEEIDLPKTMEKISAGNEEQADHQSEAPSIENVITKHSNSEGMMIAESSTKSSYDVEELENIPESHSIENSKIKDGGKITSEETINIKEATDVELQKSETESVPEDKDMSTLATLASVRVESVEKSIQEEIHKEAESAVTDTEEGQRQQNDFEEKKKVLEASDLHEVTGNTCTENEKKSDPQSEAQSLEAMVKKQLNLEGLETTEIGPSNDTEEHEKIPLSHTGQKFEIKDRGKIILEEEKEMEEAIDMQSLKYATESVPEDEAPSTSPTSEFVKGETVEKRFQEQALKEEESTTIDKDKSSRTENEIEQTTKVLEANDLPKTMGKVSTENEDHAEHQSEAQSMENMLLRHTNSERMVTTETSPKPSYDMEELEKIPESHSVKKSENKDCGKITPEEAIDIKEATAVELQKSVESVSEDKSLSTCPTIESVEIETVEKSIQEEIAVTDTEQGQRPENDFEDNRKVLEAFDLHEAPGNTCMENEKKDEPQSQAQSPETMFIKHPNLEGLETTEIIQSNDAEELEKVPTHAGEKLEIKDGRKIIQEEIKEMEEVTVIQLLKSATESVHEDETPPTLPTLKFVKGETVEKSFEEQTLKEDESTVIDSNKSCRPANELEQTTKVLEPREYVPGENFQGETQRETDTQFEDEHHISIPQNVHKTSVADGCTGNVPGTNSVYINKIDDVDLMEERKSESLENEDFSFFTTIDASEGLHRDESKKTLFRISSLMPQAVEKEVKAEIFNKDDIKNIFERKDVRTTESGRVNTSLDTIDTDDRHEESSKSEKSRDTGGSENIEEQTIDSENSLVEVKISFPREETVNQVKDHNIKNFKATDSNEQRVIKDLSFENDPTRKEAASRDSDEAIKPAATGKLETQEAETPQIGSAKEDEAGDEFKKISPSSSGIVMIKGSQDTDMKVSHKKSHGILSGVGSKVKHSISKVKKAITGKSSHPKTPSPK